MKKRPSDAGLCTRKSRFSNSMNLYSHSGIEHILIHALKGLFHSGKGKRKIDPDVAGSVELASVLPCHAYLPSGL